ncbi:MAG TPA: biotin/lipoyl-containing protein, partial [Pseudonocardia sp.]|nr:biotin/lipoyl-containing protein [Pseudonocardia sp.]
MSDEWVVTMPKLGETVTEGTIGSWRKQVGETVEFDDPLFEVSTDKVDSEIPSPYDGVVVEILVGEGETVPVGTPLIRIGGAGSAPAGADRLPSAAHGVAAGGGPALNDPANPAMGGSEGTAGADPEVGVPSGVVHDITMPKLGETVTEGTIGSWKKQVGDTVEFDDPLFEVSTDKVDSEIPSPHDGVLLEILVDEGETVAVGTVLARIGEPGATAAAAPTATPAASPSPSAAAPATQPTGSAAPAAGRNGRMLSPLVRRLVAEAGLDAATITGSGEGGRIRREDVERAIAAGTGRATPAPAAPAAPAPAAAPAAPAAPAPAPAATPAAPAARVPVAAAASGSGDARDQVVKLSRMRLAVAAGMKASQTLAASVWTSVEVDFDNVERVRQKLKDRFKAETGASLSYLPFVARA